MLQFTKYTLYVYVNILHQAAKSMAGDQSEATSRPFKYELAKLTAQLVVITLGGTAISYVFQSLGEERDARAQQAAFERQNFLDQHRDLNGLIADRVIVMDRVKARLSSGDFAAALSLKRADYDKAVAAWNQNVDRLLRSLKKLGACRPAQPMATDQCNASTPPRLKTASSTTTTTSPGTRNGATRMAASANRGASTSRSKTPAISLANCSTPIGLTASS